MKIGALPIFLIGLAVGLIALSFAFFKEWKPNKTETQYQNDQRDLYVAEGAKLPIAVKRVEKAKQMVNEKAAQWRSVVEAHTPTDSVNSGGINLAVHAWQLTVDAAKFRNNVQRAVNAQIRYGGVVVPNGPFVPAPEEAASSIVADYFNYPAIPFPVVIFDLGTVTVQGTYAQIAANVRGWSRMRKYLAVASGLALSGTSPNLTGTYNLTIVGYIRGDKVYPAVPEGAAAGGAGGCAAPARPGGGATPLGGPSPAGMAGN